MSFDQAIHEIIRSSVAEQVQCLKSELIAELTESQRKPIYFTRKQVSTFLNVSLSTIDNYVKYGLKKYKVGRSTRFLKSEIDEFIQGRSKYTK